ncbi:Scr1 family TA system antitoxin-like transcriptional regulator, partial [Micromonospora sp. LOL_023]|uniref:Scr1 family TA system antitoxin-like transcriptional regulator n=1 Tax=Micromonospora sp. LOL_023 TaxID=3345418 RepID=UPI003A8836C1
RLRRLPHLTNRDQIRHRGTTPGPWTFPKVSVRPPEPTTVYSDGPCGAIYLDKPTEIETYEGIWSSLKQHCLTPLESTEFITRIAKEFDDEG